MSKPFLCEIKIVSFNYAPKGWALCNGQFLPINQNQALFSLLGTTYGGNGQTTFALPNLRGRVPIHFGGGSRSRPGGRHDLGHHQHPAAADAYPHRCAARPRWSAPTSAPQRPDGRPTPARRPCSGRHDHPGAIYGQPASLGAMDPASVTNVGGNQPHENMSPICAQLHHRAAGHLPLAQLGPIDSA